MRAPPPMAVALLLAAMAAVAPLPLYVVSLAAFGLPHVLWELAWIRRVYGAQLQRRFWILAAVLLAAQAAARTACWLGHADASFTQALDQATLGLLLLATLLGLRDDDARRGVLRVAALGLASLLLFAAQGGSGAAVLLLLAVAHNFTPLLLVPSSARFEGRNLSRMLRVLFTLPLALAFVMLVFGAAAPGPGQGSWLPAEAAWLHDHAPRVFQALFSALVLAQCLHYYSVLRLMPGSVGGVLGAPPLRWAALLACAVLSALFLWDWLEARRIYAIAAGFHAWLEWPLILLLLVGNAAPARGATVAAPTPHPHPVRSAA